LCLLQDARNGSIVKLKTTGSKREANDSTKKSQMTENHITFGAKTSSEGGSVGTNEKKNHLRGTNFPETRLAVVGGIETAKRKKRKGTNQKKKKWIIRVTVSHQPKEGARVEGCGRERCPGLTGGGRAHKTIAWFKSSSPGKKNGGLHN